MKMTLMVLTLALAFGCSKEDRGGGKVASCHLESQHSCREYAGANLAMGTETLAELCTALVSSAKFTETACPTASVIGTCKQREHKDVFYEGYAAASSMEQSCKDAGGTFATK